jgi:cell division protein FtsB
MPPPKLLRQIVATPWLTLVLIVSSLFLLAMMTFTVWGDRGLLAMWRTQHDLERLVREIEIVEQKNAALAREVQRLRSDLVYIEKIAREELGLVRPGEIVFEFTD